MKRIQRSSILQGVAWLIFSIPCCLAQFTHRSEGLSITEGFPRFSPYGGFYEGVEDILDLPGGDALVLKYRNAGGTTHIYSIDYHHDSFGGTNNGSIGISTPETGSVAFTQGNNLEVGSNETSEVSYYDTGGFAYGSFYPTQYLNGAEEGINYIRVDINYNSIYETVVEVELNGGGGRFRRLIVDLTGADLSIPRAIAAVPEPSTGILAFFGLSCFLSKRRRR